MFRKVYFFCSSGVERTRKKVISAIKKSPKKFFAILRPLHICPLFVLLGLARCWCITFGVSHVTTLPQLAAAESPSWFLICAAAVLRNTRTRRKARILLVLRDIVISLTAGQQARIQYGIILTPTSIVGNSNRSYR